MFDAQVLVSHWPADLVDFAPRRIYFINQAFQKAQLILA
jgi:hypothetical protein